MEQWKSKDLRHNPKYILTPIADSQSERERAVK